MAAGDTRTQTRRIAGGGGADTRVIVTDGRAQVKIETSPVARGTGYPARSMPTSEAVTERFGFFTANIVTFEDLYGGKRHAALSEPLIPFSAKQTVDTIDGIRERNTSSRGKYDPDLDRARRHRNGDR